ncbi:hypothetical protein FPOAC2_03910 [Fusarium poae]
MQPLLRCAGFRFSSSKSSVHVAVLYQALDSPIINGIRKPKKPGGYQDSGADIAYNLHQCDDVQVVTPNKSPDPRKNGDWCFPDTEEGILEAIHKGANYLWANTIVFASHPLQTSTRLTPVQDAVRVIGQGPLVVDKYDDKKFVNDYLRAVGGFTLPRTFTASSLVKVTKSADDISYPVVAKPIRGRSSFGVKDSSESPFALFDVNMKPNMTGPGRPGREDQASLTLLAANGLGWDYKELLRQIIGTSSTLRTLRRLKPVEQI